MKWFAEYLHQTNLPSNLLSFAPYESEFRRMGVFESMPYQKYFNGGWENTWGEILLLMQEVLEENNETAGNR